MTGAMFTGIGLTLAAGAMSGNCMLPMKYARQWRPENVWFVFSIVSLLVLPWALAFALVNQPIEVYRRLPMSAMMAPLCFGAGWGIAQILFGVSIRRLGMSVGYAIIVGLGAVLGTLVPLFVGQRTLVSNAELVRILAGVVVMVLGIALTAWGFLGIVRNRRVIPEQPRPDATERNFAQASLRRSTPVSPDRMRNNSLPYRT